jgi:hypothetical protein
MGDKAVTLISQPTYEILDERTMTSNRDQPLPAQKSVKAYVDSSLGIGVAAETAAEVNKLAGVTVGTVKASKALVVDANKRLDTLVVGTLKLGAGAGTALTPTAA